MATYPTPSSSSDMSPPDDHDLPIEGAASGEEQSDHEEAASGEQQSDHEAEANMEETGREADPDEASGSDKKSESGWNSDTKSEHGPGEPSYDKLLEWWNKTNDCDSDLNAISKTLSKIKTARTANWKRELKGVITKVDQVLKIRDQVKDALGDDDDTNSVVSGSTISKEIRPLRTCKPIFAFVPWKRMEAWRFGSFSYAAIEIPSDKAPDHFFEVVPVHPNGPAGPPPPYTGPRLDPPDQLPNRIRINSLRLQRLLVEERRAVGDSIGPGELTDVNSRLILFKPYKMLHYLETRIRDRLHNFEEARTKRWPGSEEEHTAAYDEDPTCDQMYAPNPVDEMMFSDLTAWINDCRCLVQFIDRFMIPDRTRVADAVSTAGSIQFPDLWHAFPVGSLVYLKDENVPQRIWKVAYTFYGRQQFDFSMPQPTDNTTASRPATFFLDCYYLEYDGNRYVPVPQRFQVRHWEGFQAFSSMFPLVPLTVAGQDDTLDSTDMDKIIGRGKKYIEYTSKPRHLYYSGRSLSLTPYGTKLSNAKAPEEPNRVTQYSVRIDSPVMVDFARGFQEVPGWRPSPTPMNATTMDRRLVVFNLSLPPLPPPPAPPPNWQPRPGPPPTSTRTHVPPLPREADEIVVDGDQSWDRRIRDRLIERESKKWSLWEAGSQPIEEEDILLLPARVIAFVFRTRKWANLDLGGNKDETKSLTEIVTRAEPWTDLKLPAGHKEVVQSLITWHFKPNKAINPHFDLVRDKGKGVIILLHGVPGVGKTSTAECAAESNGRPLFPITCGDLGLTPQDVETKLDEVFRLAQAWGCILLLDEADVFLAQRTTSDMQRNALVSVFLRTLEHYEGILFLTTNRVGVFDEAFKSRIHISLYYPSLDYTQTYQIWETHIKKAIEAGITVDQEELISFAGKIHENQKDPKSGPVWNGRQIRNAFQSALALAGFHAKEGDPLKLERQHFQKVFTASDKFSNYIWRVRLGHTDADWNKMSGTRRDHFDYVSPPGMDAMNNAIVPQGPYYGGFPGGQSTFGGGPGSFPQSTFGQNFGVQPGMQRMQPQMSGMFGAANQFQQFAQPQYQQPSATGQQPAANFASQPQQQQAVPSQATALPTQYNHLQTGQFVQQNPMQQQSNMPQQNTFQQDNNFALFAQQQTHQAGITLQTVNNLQPNPQPPNPAQQHTLGTQQQTGTGLMTPEGAAAAAQQQALGSMQTPPGHSQQGTGMGSGL